MLDRWTKINGNLSRFKETTVVTFRHGELVFLVLLSEPSLHSLTTLTIIVKPGPEVPKSKVPKSRPKGLGLTQ